MTDHPQQPTPDTPLVIYGAGGHGTVVADAAELAGYKVVGFLDDREQNALAPAEMLLSQNDPKLAGANFIPAIGDNATRAAVMQKIEQLGGTVVNVIHPAASVSPHAKLGHGIYVAPQAVINPHAVVGDGCIVNSAAVVEHHCTLGNFAHLAPGAVLGGAVTIGNHTLIGLGARVLPQRAVGDRCVVGAGGVVTRDFESDLLLVGVPAVARRA
ncbi:MAG: acetyltransferase [Planctomycetota bacterium]